MSLHIVILAAGKGTRMYSQQPKVLHPIGGKAMLEHIIDTASELQPDSIHAVIGFAKEKIMAKLEHKNIQWVIQHEQLGTADAVKAALPHLPKHGKLLILAGDVPLIDVQTLQQLIHTAGQDIGLLIDNVDNPTGYGRIIRNTQQQVIAIVEEKDASEAQKHIHEINTGIMLVPLKPLHLWLNQLNTNNTQGEYYLTDIIALAKLDNMAIHPLTVRHSYLAAGVNNKQQLAQLERIYQHNLAIQLMQQGVSLLDPHRMDIRGTIRTGQDVTIDVNCVFEGENILGDDVTIGANCVLKNVTIGRGTHIKPFSHLEDCSIGEEAQIGPYARLRPHAVLSDKVHIGNFVEVKNSQIGTGSKINHLSYIGDTSMGERTNIGAGTITANYDGVNKHHTQIGNDVRIGSNTVLVAPVNVGNKATIGAGSVITRACPEGKLTLARTRQNTLDNWVRPEKPTKNA